MGRVRDRLGDLLSSINPLVRCSNFRNDDMNVVIHFGGRWGRIDHAYLARIDPELDARYPNESYDDVADVIDKESTVRLPIDGMTDVEVLKTMVKGHGTFDSLVLAFANAAAQKQAAGG